MSKSGLRHLAFGICHLPFAIWPFGHLRGAFFSDLRDSSLPFDAIDQSCCGIPLLYGLQDHPTAPRLDGISPDDLIGGPVPAPDQDCGLDPVDDLFPRGVVEDR